MTETMPNKVGFDSLRNAGAALIAFMLLGIMAVMVGADYGWRLAAACWGWFSTTPPSASRRPGAPSCSNGAAPVYRPRW